MCSRTIPSGGHPLIFPLCLQSGHPWPGYQHSVAVYFHPGLAEHPLPERRPHSFSEDLFDAGEESFAPPPHPVGGFYEENRQKAPHFSGGMKIENPRFFRTDEKALAKAQRRLSKVEKGTPERKKARKIVAHIHERIANRRLNFAHQTSRKVVNRFGTIVFEDLDITNMQKNHHLAKSIADVAWNMFISITESKAEEAGSRVILVNPEIRLKCAPDVA
jgi:IS605 OrfB family transposase